MRRDGQQLHDGERSHGWSESQRPGFWFSVLCGLGQALYPWRLIFVILHMEILLLQTIYLIVTVYGLGVVFTERTEKGGF